MRRRFVALIILLALAYLSFGRGLSYAFWEDDWRYLWFALHPLRYPIVAWLHPGTLIEFFLLIRLLGQNAFLWQHVGIILKAAAALGVMDMSAALFGSRAMSWIVGVVFVTTPLGMEAINWPSAHVTNLDVLLICEATALYIAYKRGQKTLLAPLIWFTTAFVLDPIRIVSLAWVPLFLNKRPLFDYFRARNRRELFVWACGVTLYIFVAVLLVWPAYVTWWKFDFLNLARLPFYKNIFHIPHIVWNLFTGWIISVPHGVDYMNISVFSPMRVVAGSVLMFLVAGKLVWSGKAIRRTREYRAVVFAGFWIVSTVIVQWIADPSYITATIHRYMVLPSVGLAILIGWGLARLGSPTKWLALLLYVGIVWHTESVLFDEMDGFRPTQMADRIWQTIDRVVPPHGALAPIVVMQDEGYGTSTMSDDYTAHFILMRYNQGIDQRVLFTTDYNDVAGLLCRPIGFPQLYSVKDVYAFTISALGRITDDTQQYRARLLADPLVQEHCAAPTPQ